MIGSWRSSLRSISIWSQFRHLATRSNLQWLQCPVVTWSSLQPSLLTSQEKSQLGSGQGRSQITLVKFPTPTPCSSWALPYTLLFIVSLHSHGSMPSFPQPSHACTDPSFLWPSSASAHLCSCLLGFPVLELHGSNSHAACIRLLPCSCGNATLLTWDSSLLST